MAVVVHLGMVLMVVKRRRQMAVGSRAGRVGVHPTKHVSLACGLCDDHLFDLHAAVLGCVGTDALGWEVGTEDGDQGARYGRAEGCAHGFGAGERHPVSYQDQVSGLLAGDVGWENRGRRLP